MKKTESKKKSAKKFFSPTHGRSVEGANHEEALKKLERQEKGVEVKEKKERTES